MHSTNAADTFLGLGLLFTILYVLYAAFMAIFLPLLAVNFVQNVRTIRAELQRLNQTIAAQGVPRGPAPHVAPPAPPPVPQPAAVRQPGSVMGL